MRREEDQVGDSNRKDLSVGYNETPKAYRVYIPEQKKTIMSRDVKFEEDFASKKSHKSTSITEDEDQKVPKV